MVGTEYLFYSVVGKASLRGNIWVQSSWMKWGREPRRDLSSVPWRRRNRKCKCPETGCAWCVWWTARQSEDQEWRQWKSKVVRDEWEISQREIGFQGLVVHGKVFRIFLSWEVIIFLLMLYFGVLHRTLLGENENESGKGQGCCERAIWLSAQHLCIRALQSNLYCKNELKTEFCRIKDRLLFPSNLLS